MRISVKILTAVTTLIVASVSFAAKYELEVSSDEARTAFKMNLAKTEGEVVIQDGGKWRTHKLNKKNSDYLQNKLKSILTYEQPKLVQCPRSHITLDAKDEKITRIYCQNARTQLADELRNLISTLLAFNQVHKGL